MMCHVRRFFLGERSTPPELRVVHRVVRAIVRDVPEKTPREREEREPLRRRDGVERTNTLLGLMADDLRNLHGGASGDLLVDWQPFDGLADRAWPRLRLVRQVGAAAVQQLQARAAEEAAAFAASRGEAPAPTSAPDGRAPAGPLPEATGLVEVAWVLVPDDAGPDRFRGVRACPAGPRKGS